MARYLVVAHETVTNPALLKQVRAIREQDEAAEFVLLVPATPVRHLLFRRGDEQDAALVARKLADRAGKLFAKKGLPFSDVRVGSAHPIEAIDAEVTANPGYAGFVISTLPKEKSRWLQLDLPRAVRTKYDLPVHHVVAAQDYTLADLP
jgi:GABA permease